MKDKDIKLIIFISSILLFTSCIGNKQEKESHRETDSLECNKYVGIEDMEGQDFVWSKTDARDDSLLFEKIIKAIKNYPDFYGEEYTCNTHFIVDSTYYLIFKSKYLSTEKKVDLIHIVKMCEVEKFRNISATVCAEVRDSIPMIVQYPELYLPALYMSRIKYNLEINKDMLFKKIPSRYQFLYEKYLKDIEVHNGTSSMMNAKDFYKLELHQRYDLGLPPTIEEFLELYRSRWN